MHRYRRSLLAAALTCAALFTLQTPAQAQSDAQPIRIIFPYAAGGGGDLLARLVAERMQAELKRPVIVENRTGGAGQIGVMAVRNAAPDGNTLLIVPIAPMAVYQHTYSKLSYDPIGDFAPVTQLGTFDFGIAVGKAVSVKTLKELVEWAKAHPAKANCGVPSAGSLPHFLCVMFSRAAGLDMRPVPYKGSAAAVADFIAGHTPVLVTTVADQVKLHGSGPMRVLATSGTQRSPFLPDVPTFREAGYDLQAESWYGMFAPAKTPPEIIERYNVAAVAAVRSPDIVEKLKAIGVDPTGTSAAELAAIQKADAELFGPIIKESGFRADK